MEDIYKTLIPILFGGVVGYVIQYFLNKRKESESNLYKINEERFKNILNHMNIILNPENLKFMDHRDPATGKQFNREDHFQFLNAEYLVSILYASDEVVKSIKRFIQEPNNENFIETAKSMRKSLWNKKSKLTIDELKI